MATETLSGGNIEPRGLEEEMKSSYLDYAMSVIVGRALPDARDGLKPVQRRILFGMSELGLRPDRGHVKSSRVVGEVMGKYHPHGDGAIYDALVRMAQPFTMRLPLVDGHGNFGSLDDGPAASRYTEARLAPAALLMTGSLDEETVDFVPNYDDQLLQPGVLPAAYPNLLVNGASGIAVGMATNMAPHNLVEVIGAARHLLAHPDAGLDDLMRFVPGPDLPTGGRIVGLGQLVVVVRHEVDDVLVETRRHRQGGGRHARLGVAGRGGSVVERAEVAVAVDQRQAQRERLGQTHHRVVDRRVAVRVQLAHDLADDARRLHVRAVRAKAHLRHLEEDAALHRLEPVAGVRQGTGVDHRVRVLQEGALHFGRHVDIDDVFRVAVVHDGF